MRKISSNKVENLAKVDAKVSSSIDWGKFFDWALMFLFLVNVILVPFFLDKRITNPFVLPKECLLVGLILLSFLLYALKSLVTKSIKLRFTLLDLPFLAILFLSLFSAIFSRQLSDSFFGRPDYFGLSFSVLASLYLFYLLAVNVLNTKEKMLNVLNLFIGLGLVTELFFVAQVVFKFSLPVIGSTNILLDGLNGSFGFWSLLTMLISASLFMFKQNPLVKSLFYFLTFILGLAVCLILGFNLLWWFLVIGLGLVILVGIASIHEVKVWWLSILFAVFIVGIGFIIFGSPKFLQAQLSPEISLGFKPSVAITEQTLFSGVKEFALGSGLGTFGIDFSQYRSGDFNYDQVAWPLRFNQPMSSIFALLCEGGLFLAAVFIGLMLLVSGYVFHNCFRKKVNNTKDRLLVLCIFAPWLFLSLGMLVIFYSLSLWWVWFLFTAFLILALHNNGEKLVIREKNWRLEETPQYNLVFSFAVVFLAAMFVLLAVFGGKFYLADLAYNRALTINDLPTAQNQLERAVNFRSSLDIYHLALARLYLLQSAQFAKNNDAQKMSEYVIKSINEAKLATTYSPNSVAVWENLTTVYENASALAPEIQEWAVKSLNQAITLEPSNPIFYWRLGNNYAINKKYPEATSSYNKSIALKKDYLPAYIGLAGVYEANKQIDEAIKIYTDNFVLVRQNPDALFNLGRLLYNRNKKDDRSNAEQIWLEAVRQQPNNSNALFSLGLLYENQGETAKAINYYGQVAKLNPDNAEIKAKLESLNGQVNQAETVDVLKKK